VCHSFALGINKDFQRKLKGLLWDTKYLVFRCLLNMLSIGQPFCLNKFEDK
jgi:hypothetical protein